MMQDKEDFIDKFIVGLDNSPREYVISGVRYVVESRFQKPKEKTMLKDRVGNYLTSDFADLPSNNKESIIDNEYDCTAAEK